MKTFFALALVLLGTAAASAQVVVVDPHHPHHHHHHRHYRHHPHH